MDNISARCETFLDMVAQRWPDVLYVCTGISAGLHFDMFEQIKESLERSHFATLFYLTSVSQVSTTRKFQHTHEELAR
jgi:hypothetical protein